MAMETAAPLFITVKQFSLGRAEPVPQRGGWEGEHAWTCINEKGEKAVCVQARLLFHHKEGSGPKMQFNNNCTTNVLRVYKTRGRVPASKEFTGSILMMRNKTEEAEETKGESV